MQILLTGGLGYIGSHTYIELMKNIDNYEDVIIVDNLSNSKYEQLDKIKSLTNKNIKFYNIDLLDTLQLEKVFDDNNISSVIHFAGLKSVNDSISKPLYYYEHNIIILINLLKIMMKYNCKKIIFSSSCTVYGNNVEKVDETMITGTNITNSYGKTKYFQEEILKDLFTSDNTWNITILRYFNPVGNHESGVIGDNPNFPTNLFPCILNSIKNNDILKIYGNDYDTYDGTCIRDFIHVVDLANAHIIALKHCGKLNIYNVGTGVETSILKIVKTFENINSIKLNYSFCSKRDGDIKCIYADNVKIKEIGWEAKKNIDDMCRDAFIFYKKNSILH